MKSNISMKTSLMRCTCIFLFVFTFEVAKAFDPTDEFPADPAPFDGGVSLLVAAGIGYGVKKVYDKRKGEKT